MGKLVFADGFLLFGSCFVLLNLTIFLVHMKATINRLYISCFVPQQYSVMNKLVSSCVCLKVVKFIKYLKK